jgi:small subunit ribosomal protein S26e
MENMGFDLSIEVLYSLSDSILYYIPPNDSIFIIAKFYLLRCASTGKAIPKDKAIKRFIVRNIVDASSLRDIKEASAYQEYQLPKLYLKMYYCVEAAVHQRIVRGRSKEARKIRTPPERKFVRKA